MVGGVLNLSFTFTEFQDPRISSCCWIAVYGSQKIHAVFHGLEIFLLAKLPIGLRIVEYEPSAADQVPGGGIVDGAVVLEKMIKTSTRIDCAGVVESHGLPD